MHQFGEIDIKLDDGVVTVAFDREANWWSTDDIPASYADFIQSKVNAEFEGMGYVMRTDWDNGDRRYQRVRGLRSCG
jgi:hypothetical protein